ncbi:ANR family transcriptional regulator [Salmonella enterica]|nr:ANR family transcriptional regulator [Salmonella enterica subsp. arizonae serovar 63:z4,z32:-]
MAHGCAYSCHPGEHSAMRLEQAGEYDRAAKVWAKANRESRNPVNQQWSDNRADFCIMQNIRSKRKEVDDAR